MVIFDPPRDTPDGRLLGEPIGPGGANHEPSNRGLFDLRNGPQERRLDPSMVGLLGTTGYDVRPLEL